MVVVPIDDRLFDGRPVVAVRDRSRTGGKLSCVELWRARARFNRLESETKKRFLHCS